MHNAHSLLLMGFGQSNMDFFQAQPCIFPDVDNKSPIYCPNDGLGIRGRLGLLIGEGPNPDDFTGLIPIREDTFNGQSMLAVAAETLYRSRKSKGLERVVVRSEARGGRPLIGYNREITGRIVEVEGIFRTADGSLGRPFRNLLKTTINLMNLAKETGPPIKHIYLCWAHGEADRSKNYDSYLKRLYELMDYYDEMVSEQGASVTWMFIQPGGTNCSGNGNRWPNRLVLLEVSDQRENAFTCAAAYWTPLHDGIHYSAQGRVALGERVGQMIARIEAGESGELPRPRHAVLDGNKLIVTFDTDAPLLLDEEADIPVEPAYGFQSFDLTRTTIKSVEILGSSTVCLTFENTPDYETLQVVYAYRNWTIKDDSLGGSSELPIGRGALRTVDSPPSEFLEKKAQHTWVASFSITKDDIEFAIDK
ncbi:MAG: hypothetical protein ACI84R_002474 [Candidatus Azotimanducaceae bacterium]|jgi:hypothetical protein